MRLIITVALVAASVAALQAETGAIANGAPPLATPVASTATDASVSTTLVEDLNQNSQLDDADGVPAQTVAILSLMEDGVSGTIVLYTATDGSLRFENVPSGDYVIRVAWAGGFVEPPGAEAQSHFIEIVFRVQPDGTVAAPNPHPEFWPSPAGTPLREFDPEADNIVLGAPPATILLARKDPGMLPYPTDVEFDSIAVATGSIDVDRAFSSRGLDKPTELFVGGDEIRWADRSTGEAGYRVTATIGTTTRVFEQPADARSIGLPQDFRPSCGGELGSTLEVSVVAFTRTAESEAATGSLAGLCPPSTATPSTGVRLPETGTGPTLTTVSPSSSVLAQESTVSVQVVYDANNNGVFDEGDVPLPDRKVIVAALDVSGQELDAREAATGAAAEAATIPASTGLHRIVATGPAQLQDDIAAKRDICRGWRTSFLEGARVVTGDFLQDQFGFTADLTDENVQFGKTVILGLSDKGAVGTEFEGSQIVCPDAAGGVDLPNTGSGRDEFPLQLMPIAAIGLAAVAILVAFSALRRANPGHRS